MYTFASGEDLNAVVTALGQVHDQVVALEGAIPPATDLSPILTAISALNDRITALEALHAEGPTDPEPEEPATEPFWIMRHSPANKANFWGSIASTSWADGAFVYYPGPFGNAELKWDTYWAGAVAAHPEGMPTVVSPKVLDEAALLDFCQQLPPAWAHKMTYAYYQEPEDNHTTDAQRADFRAKVKRAGEIVRPFGIKNAVELQAWTIHPGNANAWGGQANLAAFVVEADIDHISWSIYEKNLKGSTIEDVARVKAFMANYPSLTWDASACGVSVPVGTATTAQRQLRATIVDNLINAVKAAGATGFGYFDFPNFSATNDYASDEYLDAVLNNH